MIISGPILAMSIACGSFAIVAVTVMTIPKTTLQESHYKNMSIYGKDELTAAEGDKILVSTIVSDEKEKKFECYWDSIPKDAAGIKEQKIKCSIAKETVDEISKEKEKANTACKATISGVGTTDIYKITAARSKLKDWTKDKSLILIKIVNEEQKYSTIKVSFSVDGDVVKCKNS